MPMKTLTTSAKQMQRFSAEGNERRSQWTTTKTPLSAEGDERRR